MSVVGKLNTTGFTNNPERVEGQVSTSQTVQGGLNKQTFVAGKVDSNDDRLTGSANGKLELTGQVSTDLSIQGSAKRQTSLAGYAAASSTIVQKIEDDRYYFNSLALAKAAAATAEEVGSPNTIYYYGMKLMVDDGVFAKWYVIQRDGTLREDGLEIAGTDNTLIVENGILRVNTTNDTAADNTLPITSAGVYTQLGNIGALLETI